MRRRKREEVTSKERAAHAARSGRSCTKEAMRPCKLHVAGSKPAASTSQRGVMVTCLVANEALRVRFTASAPPAFVAQLAEHRTLNSEVAGSYPVDSLQSAMPQRSGAPLRMECNSQAGSTPVVDNLESRDGGRHADSKSVAAKRLQVRFLLLSYSKPRGAMA